MSNTEIKQELKSIVRAIGDFGAGGMGGRVMTSYDQENLIDRLNAVIDKLVNEHNFFIIIREIEQDGTVILYIDENGEGVEGLRNAKVFDSMEDAQEFLKLDVTKRERDKGWDIIKMRNE